MSKSTSDYFGRVIRMGFLSACLCIAGCSDKREPIRSFVVDRLPATHQIDAVIVPGDQETWFIKMTGDLKQSADAADQFAELARSLQWPEGASQPRWTLPAGWSEQPTRDRMVFANIATGPAGPEVTVTRLPNNPRISSEQYLLLNVNRWRKQLGLAPLDEQQMREQSQPLPLRNGLVASCRGRLPKKPNAGSPPGPAVAASAPLPPSPPGGDEESAAPLTYERPEGWQQGESSAFSVASFSVQSGQRLARITISAAGGDTAANVNRWRGQVGLPAQSAAEIEAQSTSIPVGNQPAKLFRLVGADQTIIGVIAPAADTTWFIKLTGESSLAAEQYEPFVKFVESIKFRK